MTKLEELETLRVGHPAFSPFALLKLSMIRYGAVFTERALDSIQGSPYAFGDDNAFDIRFGGRDGRRAMPGPILLRDGSFVYVNYGEPYENPYTIDCDGGVYLLLDGDKLMDTLDFY